MSLDPVLSNAALVAKAPSSGALREDKDPRNLAIGVRAKLTNTGLIILIGKVHFFNTVVGKVSASSCFVLHQQRERDVMMSKTSRRILFIFDIPLNPPFG